MALALLVGFAFGYLGSMPVAGPISVLVLHLGLAHEGRRAFHLALGGALGGLLYIRVAPRRGFNFMLSESWYGFRNRYYRWKRRRAARKFEVYMRSQGRTVRFDGNGRQIDEDQDDKKRWN